MSECIGCRAAETVATVSYRFTAGKKVATPKADHLCSGCLAVAVLAVRNSAGAR